MRYFIFLIVLFLSSYSHAFNAPIIGGSSTAAGGGPGACTEYYNGGWTSDTATRGVGEYSNVDYYGMLYTPGDTDCVCEILVYNEQIDGTLSSSHDYYVVIFSLSGNNAASILGTSSKVDGDSMSNDTWYTFDFSPCVTLTAATQYGIGVFVDRDSVLTDDPENDTTNHWNFGDDNNNGGDAITGGRISWEWDSSIPYTGTLQDANDDPLFVIYAE